ncbi:unnamed protein product [Thelazia callipaeda]|uniref:Uncharacterized protein n=1 Tax=Thelazia callipaeda TaxID=103827 RepID=A0A0N5CNY8_THECL|nr:unnamed protein product [Thelazia callipaeda]
MSTQEQILKEPDSTLLSFVTSPQFDDRRYRFLRTYTPTPYRSPFNTSTISLPEIKEVTNEDNDTSSTTSSKSSLQAHKIVSNYCN